ncbi:hypothetical protein N0V84_006672 [Fusarium piperis]|uniref:Uncharacterized protein n=1 Tax=Fusarium piperis TaxID=1435070 RepID=A0A9W9BP38_9HYPO|nr:hypothetical protein N0V84_006672 [Fusarium piperis]
MDGLEPDFRVRVWRYTYKAEGHGGDTILLNSPQESPDEHNDTLVLRQINSDAENKVWVQEQASQHFKRHVDAPEGPLMDDAHGVIVRDGHAKVIPRQGEMAVTHNYNRGDRIWIERSLVPTHNIDDDENRVPVIDLESLRVFELPYEYICFVPQLSKRSESGEQHTAVVGSEINTFLDKKKTKARIYFRWMADTPDKVSYVWLNKKDKHDLKEMDSYAKIQSLERKRRLFGNQWHALTKRLALLGLLMGDEMIPGGLDRLESSSSDSDAGDLDLRWKTGPTATSYCNLDPCPAFNDPDIDLVASYIGGYRQMEHYHVQDDDVDECPRGSEHKGHCVLRDNRTRCAYATDRVPHTCCKLRVNPILPGPNGDPDDVTLPLWETTAGDDYFINATRNVRTRRELEDRDEIPPQLLQMKKEAARQTSIEPTDGADKADQDEADELVKDGAMDEGPREDDPMIDHSADDTSMGDGSIEDDSMENDSIEDDSLESNSMEENSMPIDDARNESTWPRDSPGPPDAHEDASTTTANPPDEIPIPLGYSLVQQYAEPFYQPTYQMFPYAFPQNDPFGFAPPFDPADTFDPLYPNPPQDPST